MWGVEILGIETKLKTGVVVVKGIFIEALLLDSVVHCTGDLPSTFAFPTVRWCLLLTPTILVLQAHIRWVPRRWFRRGSSILRRARNTPEL